ncbi:MAG: right-handed parallel beta-helix repeat-containing protein [Chloroflexaceae bacterium]|jgi:hypothetical protein|nr:right-handed parallel beta-helix repeat-containing protein [Chloroflexaceae bacterium]
MRFISYLGLFALAVAFMLVPALRPLPSSAAAPFDGVTLHLNPQATNASDANDGSEASPLKTIVGALEKMVPVKQSGRNVRILFYPGTYRDYLITGGDGQDEPIPWPAWKIPENDAQLVFEAKEYGTAIISGSDVWKGWQNDGSGVWAKEWPYNWGAPGATPNPDAGPPIAELVARRELVFVNGERLRQVLQADELQPGTFRVDEAANRITLKLRDGLDPNSATTEVGVRSRLLHLWNQRNISVRGLVFQHAVDRLGQAAVAFQTGDGTNFPRKCRNITVEDTLVVQNGQVGLESYCENTLFRRNQVNDNGFTGIAGGWSQGWLLEDNVTNRNAWRAWAGGYKGWATAGVKVLLVTDFTARRHTSLDNQGDGFWVDTQNVNVTVEDSTIARNRWNGLFFEASKGPFVARNNLICGNGLSDVVLGAAAKVTLENNRILSNTPVNSEYPNQSLAILFGETRRKEPGGVGVAKAEYPLREITLRGNQIQAVGSGRF